MDKEIIDKVMFDNFLSSVPTMVVDAKDRKTISAYGSIDVNDLRSAIDTFKKVPDYGELLKQVKKQKKFIDKAMIELDTIINDLEKHGDEAPAPSKEELCKIFNILNEVTNNE